MSRRNATQQNRRSPRLVSAALPINFAPTIASVSQTAGKAAGGSTVSIIGTNFAPAMTSVLGTVAYIDSTHCTITTSAHAAGSLTWTLTNGIGPGPSKTFTYLSAPTLTSLSPSSGPATITNTGVTFTGTNFPASGTGCPMTVTVGAGTGTPTLNNSTTCSSSFTAPGTGTLSATVTVDGVTSSTLASAYTGNPAPAFTSATNIGTSGGTVNVVGTNFVSLPTMSVSGGIGALSVAFTDSSHIMGTLGAGSYTAGRYTLTITNPDGQSVVIPNGCVISATLTPDVILGSRLRVWARATACTSTGNNTPVTAIQDLAGIGNTATTITAVNYLASDPDFKNQPSFGFNGTSSGVLYPSVNSGTNTVFLMLAMKLGAAGSAPNFVASGNRYRLGGSSTTGNPLMDTAIWGASVVNTPCSVYGYSQGTGASTENVGVSVNNGIAVTSTDVQLEPDPTGDAISIGSAYNGTTLQGPFAQMTTPEWIFADAIPTATEIAQIAAYLNLRYQLNPTMVLTSTTKMSHNAGGSFRILGANYVSGATVTVGGGVGAAAVTFIASTTLDCVVSGAVAAGTYDLTVANPDGDSIFVPGALTVTANDFDDPMAALGTSCILWMQGDSVTQSSGTVSAFLDKSLRGNDCNTHTAVTWTATDAGVNNQPYATYNGTTSFSTQSLTVAASTGSPLFLYVVARLTATGVNAVFLDLGGVDELRFQANSGVPGISFGSTTTNWGASVGTTNAVQIYVYETGGGSWTQAVSVAASGIWGTEVTSSVTSTALTASSTLLWGKRAGGNFNSMRLFAAILCNVKPTTAALNSLGTWAHNKFGV